MGSNVCGANRLCDPHDLLRDTNNVCGADHLCDPHNVFGANHLRYSNFLRDANDLRRTDGDANANDYYGGADANDYYGCPHGGDHLACDECRLLSTNDNHGNDNNGCRLRAVTNHFVGQATMRQVAGSFGCEVWRLNP